MKRFICDSVINPRNISIICFKFLLREPKRHTARHVASTPYAVLVGGTPPILGSDLYGWGTCPAPPPIQGSDLDRGYLLCPPLLLGSDRGVPAPSLPPILGYDLDRGISVLPPPPLGSDLDGGTCPSPTPILSPHLELGRGYIYPPAWTWEGGTPMSARWWFPSPPPPRNGGQSENITFRQPSDAGGKLTK